MGALNPLFLLAAAAAAVPILLHILQRRKGRRTPFPALRYLRAVTREQARSVRLRQLFLLALRVLAILFVVGGGARLYLEVRGQTHEPTALAIIVDNSMSTAAVQDDEPVLEGIRRDALRSVERAGEDDLIWVFPASEPWRLTTPGGPEAARDRIESLEPTDASARLEAMIERASAAVRASELDAAEVHLYTDLQATSLPADGVDEALAGVPLVVRPAEGSPPPNRWVSNVQVGGGLPPVAGDETEMTVEVQAAASDGTPDDGEASVRVELDGELTGTRQVEPGGSSAISVGPFDPGWVSGFAETDPDALRRDDRRHFAFRVREPPQVQVTGPVGTFLEGAVETLEDAGRVRTAEPDASSDVRVMDGAEDDGSGGARVLVAPADPSRVPAFNQHLESQGLSWELVVREATGGSVGVASWDLPLAPHGVTVESGYRLEPRGSDPPEGAAVGTLEDGSTWMAAGADDAEDPVLILGTPLDPDHTSLPLQAVMVPFVDWLVGGWQGTGEDGALHAGDALPLPEGVTDVEDPSGTLHPAHGTSDFAVTGEAGIYRLLQGDSLRDKVAVNPSAMESRLERVPGDEAEARLGSGATVTTSDDAWEGAAFATRRGMELWRPLILGALLLLLVEAWAAAGGGRSGRPQPAPQAAAPGKETEPHSGGT